MGYWKAGFRVIGIDNKPMPHYPSFHQADYARDFQFIQMDALEFLDRYIAGEFERADAFHASPPCQFISKASQQWRKAGKVYPDFIMPTRERLIKIGLPYGIENVAGEPYLNNPIKLKGSYFGMNVRRTRCFETSFPIDMILLPKECPSGFRTGRPIKEGDFITPVGHFSNIPYARRQMGIDWMTGQRTYTGNPACIHGIYRQVSDKGNRRQIMGRIGGSMKYRKTGSCELCGQYCGRGKYRHYRRYHKEYQFRRRKTNGRQILYCQLCDYRSSDYRRMVEHCVAAHGVGQAKQQNHGHEPVGFIRRILNWFY